MRWKIFHTKPSEESASILEQKQIELKMKFFESKETYIRVESYNSNLYRVSSRNQIVLRLMKSVAMVVILGTTFFFHSAVEIALVIGKMFHHQVSNYTITIIYYATRINPTAR